MTSVGTTSSHHRSPAASAVSRLQHADQARRLTLARAQYASDRAAATPADLTGTSPCCRKAQAKLASDAAAVQHAEMDAGGDSSGAPATGASPLASMFAVLFASQTPSDSSDDTGDDQSNAPTTPLSAVQNSYREFAPAES